MVSTPVHPMIGVPQVSPPLSLQVPSYCESKKRRRCCDGSDVTPLYSAKNLSFSTPLEVSCSDFSTLPFQAGSHDLTSGDDNAGMIQKPLYCMPYLSPSPLPSPPFPMPPPLDVFCGTSSALPSQAGNHGSESGDEDTTLNLKPRGNVWWRLLRITFPDVHFLLLAVAGAAVSGAFNPAFGLIITTERNSGGRLRAYQN